MRTIARRLVPCVALALALAGCKHRDPNAPLAFVPADTPYVFANADPLPEAVLQAYEQHMPTLWKAQFGGFGQLADALREKDPDTARALDAVGAEIGNLDTPQKWRQAGVDTRGHYAFYGVGLAPVARVELADAAAFRALVGRIEQRMGRKLAVGTLDGQSYWQLGGDSHLRVLLAIERDKQLVATLVPAQLDAPTLREVLGLQRPAKSLADAGTLEDLADARGYKPNGAGYVDTARLLARLGDPRDVLTRAYAQALGLGAPSADPACPAEFASVAAKAPRLSMGYAEISAQRIDQRIDADLAPPLVAALQKLRQPVPGMGSTTSDGLVDIALALPMLKLREFWIAQADAVAAQPFRCPTLQPLNAGFAALRQGLDRLAVPPLANVLGLRLTLARLDLGGATPAPAALAPATPMPQFGARLLVASDNPAGLFGMAKMAVPGLRDFRLAADGKPVALPSGGVPGANGPLYAAMDAHALALGNGVDAMAALPAYLGAPGGDGAALVRMSFDGRFYSALATLMQRLSAAQQAPTAPAQRAQLERQRQLFAMYAQWIRRGDAQLELNAHGLRLRSTTTLN
ncbi:MAG: hypothetical protein ABFC67_00930 [Mizugakiibacter sp.]|uniref:hypothetical protein n=1 Tax=Mizugakiibacter sp. TaxID=1972610 RepID=UPI0031BDCF0C|nr:hypothetical protein [Xanthomonadaceae bacterium]